METNMSKSKNVKTMFSGQIDPLTVPFFRDKKMEFE